MTWINVWTQRGTEVRPAGKRAATVGGEKLAAYAAAGRSTQNIDAAHSQSGSSRRALIPAV